MANVNRFDRQMLLELREQARMSLFFFQKAIWFDKDLTDDLHFDLCAFLQGLPPYGAWTRAAICAWRGSLKSSSERAWMVWKGLYGYAAGRSLEDVASYVEEHQLNIEAKPGVCIPDWSCLLVEQRETNAKAHHEKMQAKFRWGTQAALLQDMYRDRIPSGFEEWNSERTVFVRNDANAEPFLVHAGLDSKLESAHKNAIVGDDLEGADADKSDVPNVESEKFVVERAIPLLKEPAVGQILLTGTPHGEAPLMWKARREFRPKLEGNGTLNNAERGEWKIWWKEVLDPNTGQSRWAKRYTQSWIDDMQKQAKRSPTSRRLWQRQYMLEEDTDAGQMFDMNVAAANLYDLEAAFKIRYPAETWDKHELDDMGRPKATKSYRWTDHSQLRFFLHLDAKHRDPGDHKPDVRPSRAAIVVTGVAPDCHVMVVETWIKDAGLDEFAERFFHLYRKWAPYRFTMDTVGAQVWFRNFLRILETTKYRDCHSLPRAWRPARRLPRPSALLIEAHKANAAKEEYIIQSLEVMQNLGMLHLHKDQVELLTEMEKFPSTGYPADGLDALAQGSHVWDRFVSQSAIAALKRKMAAIQQYRMVEPLTGYVRGFDNPIQQQYGAN